MPISGLTGNGKYAVRYTHLEFRERPGWREKFLSHQHVDGFQARRPGEVTPGREKEGHGHACGPHQPAEVSRAMGKPWPCGAARGPCLLLSPPVALTPVFPNCRFTKVPTTFSTKSFLK